MINGLLGKITRFYQLSLVVIMMATLGSVVYFWQMGFLDGSRAKELHRVSYIVENIEKKRPYAEIRDLVNSQNPKLAIQKIKILEKDLEHINKHIDLPEFDKVKKENQKLKTASANLISFSKTEKVINVFNKKMDKFYRFVTLNNWRTLTRSTQRIQVMTNGHVNVKKLDTLTRNIEREFDAMKKVTENSILTRKDKSEVISRISSLRVEIDMLKKFSTERRFFSTLYNDFQKDFNYWMEKVSPEITLQKLKSEQIGRYYIMSFVGIMALVTLMFFASFGLSKIYFRKAQIQLEKSLENYVSEGLLEKKLEVFDEFSEGFQSFSRKISTYVDKRMSFGSIFQEGLPFSSLLLDRNLKIVWANKHFCNDWNLSEEEVKKDYMSWDYLSKLTNIGHDDPILEALKNHVAGIYQVQVKASESEETRPYEMFVSPVRYNNEVNIMLFFYDLTNLEETIQDQAVSILNPVRDTVTLFSKNQFEESPELKNEFGIGGIEDVYDNFVTLNTKLNEDEKGFLNQIELLHNKVEALLENNKMISNENGKSLDNYHASMKFLKDFKDNVIDLSTLSRDLDIASSEELELIYSNISTLNQSAQKVEKLKKITENLVMSMPKFDKLKDDIRTTKSALYESKMKLSHELAQLTVLFKRANDPQAWEKLSRTFLKATSSFKDLDKLSSDLDKKVSNLEVVMSKAQMVVGESERIVEDINSGEERGHLSLSQEKVKGIARLKHDSSQRIENLEEDIIKGLEGIFHTTKANQQSVGEISNFLNG